MQKIPYNDRGYNFGDGVYEYIRVYDGTLFTVKEHFERFLRSAAEIDIDLEETVESLTQTVQSLIDENDVQNGGIYIQATRGASPRDHAFPGPDVKPQIMAFTKAMADRLKN